MSLETQIAEHTAAIKELTAAIVANTAAKGGAAQTSSKSDDKPARTTRAAAAKDKEKAAEPTKTKTEVNAALNEIRSEFGADDARAIFKKYGYEKMADIKPEHYDQIAADCAAKFDSKGTGEDEDTL